MTTQRKKSFSDADVNRMAREANSYIASSEGKKDIKEALRLASESTADLKASRRVESTQLHKPVTF